MKQILKSFLHGFGLDLVTYRPFLELLPEWNIKTVLDVGANIGQFGVQLRQAGYRGHIVSFEPTREAFQRLQTRCRKDSSWEAVNMALGHETKSESVQIPSDSRLTSFLPPLRDHNFVKKEQLQITRLDEWLNQRSLDLPKTCLKLDVQGFEKEILLGCGDFLCDFGAIIVELAFCKSYQGQAHAGEMINFLQSNGFSIWATRRGLWTPQGNREMEFDALFKRIKIN